MVVVGHIRAHRDIVLDGLQPVFLELDGALLLTFALSDFEGFRLGVNIVQSQIA